MWKVICCLAAILPCTAKVQETEGDRVVVIPRQEVSGRVVAFQREGLLRVAVRGGRTVHFPVERIARIYLGKQETPKSDPNVARIQLRESGVVSGAELQYSEARLKFRAWESEFRIPRGEIRSLLLSPMTVAMPEPKEEEADLVIREVPGTGAVAEYGELVELNGKQIRLERGGETREFDRSTVRQIHFFSKEERPSAPSGWFGKVLARNGDRIVGVLSSLDERTVEVFSHVLGKVRLARSTILSITFVPSPKVSTGNVLICDQVGVKEFDRTGKEIWSYSTGVQGAWAAVKVESGNVLIANSNYSKVLEVSAEKTVAWTLDCNYPYDLQRLENGNTLVAEYYGNCVTEYDPNRRRVWSCAKVSQPTSVQRLDNGNTLIVSNNQMIEVDNGEREVWRAKLDKVQPWRAVRLDGGNTLLCDPQRGLVLEIDGQSKEVWKKEGLSRPVAAVRLEDGNTLILEQGANRMIEVDPSKRVVGEIKGLSSPQGLSVY